jgi:hypothetical protein
MMITRSALSAAIRAELEDWFSDVDDPTLGEYARRHGSRFFGLAEIGLVGLHA